MKRLLAIIMSALLLLSSCARAQSEPEPEQTENVMAGLFTTSGSSGSETSETTSPPVSDAAVTTSETTALTYDDVQAAYPEKTVLTWAVYPFFGLAESVRVTEVNAYLDSLGKDYAVCFSSLKWRGSEDYLYLTKQKISKGEPIDILSTGCYSGSTGEYAAAPHRYIIDGLFEPLDDYLQSDLGRKILEIYPENYLETLRVNGSLYGLVGGDAMVSYGNGYFVNAELSEKYGWDIEKPISEQLDILHAVSENEPDCAVFVVASSFGYQQYYLDPFVNLAGVCYDPTTDSAKRLTEDSSFIDIIRPVCIAGSEGLRTDYFNYVSDRKDGKKTTAFIIYSGSGSVQSGITCFGLKRDLLLADDIISAIDTHREQSISCANYMTGVCSASVHKDEAFDFLALSQTDRYINNFLTYVLEGDYELSDGVVKQDVVDMMTFPNPFVCYPHTGENADYADTLYGFFENAEPPAWLGFCFDVSPVSDIYARVYAAVSDWTPLSNDADQAIKELYKALTEAGIDDLIVEVNRQYGEWRKNAK